MLVWSKFLIYKLHQSTFFVLLRLSPRTYLLINLCRKIAGQNWFWFWMYKEHGAGRYRVVMMLTSLFSQPVLGSRVTSIGSMAPPTPPVEEGAVPSLYMSSICLTCWPLCSSSSAILLVVVSLIVEKSFKIKFSFKSETSLERASAART